MTHPLGGRILEFPFQRSSESLRPTAHLMTTQPKVAQACDLCKQKVSLIHIRR
jgi:hypothetical protein